MKPKEFFRRWKEGIKTLSPADQLKARLTGIKGAIVGMTIGFTIMAFRGMYYFLILGFFLVWLQVVEYINTKQQLENYKKIDSMNFSYLGVDHEIKRTAKKGD